MLKANWMINIIYRSCNATITLCDLSAAILFKLVHSCLDAFNLMQLYIVNLKESARHIAYSKTSLRLRLHGASYRPVFCIDVTLLCEFESGNV